MVPGQEFTYDNYTDYLNIGPCPCDEDCVQLGDDDYQKKSREECQRFIELIRKKHGVEPCAAKLAIKSFNHDFGTYREVVCYYDEGVECSVEYAFRCESDPPSRWSDD